MAAAEAEPAADAGARRADPLVLLRTSTLQNFKVRMADELLEFDGHFVHRSTKCGFSLSREGGLIDIGSVWYMLREVSSARAYTQDSARRSGFTYIGVVYRSGLISYLTGQVDWCEGLVRDVIEGRKRPRDSVEVLPPRTRARLSRQAPPDGGEAGGDAIDGEPRARGQAVLEVKTGELCYEDVVKRVRPVKNLDVLVRCPGRAVPNADLILRIAQAEVSHWNRHERPPNLRVPAHVPLIQELEELLQSNDGPRRGLRSEPSEQRNPIIVVPRSRSAPVNIFNGARLLMDGEFSRTETSRIQKVARNINGKMWTFDLRDDPANFSKKEWLRVVAVVADGTTWQFKGWPFESIVDLFTTIRGVFFQENGTLTPAHVKTWAVRILEMSTMEYQHRFADLRDSFWIEVEKFMNSARRRKFVNHASLDEIQITVEKSVPVL